MNACRAILYALLCALTSSFQAVQAQLDLNLSVDVRLGAGDIYTYEYSLFSRSTNSQSINSILLSTGINAPVTNTTGPNSDWVAAYAAEEEAFQAGFATGLSADGEDCGVTDEFDLYPGQTTTFSISSPWAPAEQRYAIGRTVGEGAACDFVGDFATGTIVSPSLPIRECDFDRDGDCDVSDIDQLAATIATDNTDAKFDLNLDTLVDRSDLDLFLILTQKVNGDTNFNGQVDFSDFLTVSGNFSNSGTWSQGDLDADGHVGFPDFLIFSRNFGKSSSGASAVVPEPAPNYFHFLPLLILGFGRFRPRRSRGSLRTHYATRKHL